MNTSEQFQFDGDDYNGDDTIPPAEASQSPSPILNTPTVTTLKKTELDLDTFEQKLSASIAAKSEYDEWLKQLAADCLRRGISIPTGIARGNAWVVYLRQKGIENKKRKKEETARRQIAKLQKQLGEAEKTTINTSNNEEPGDDFFANIDAEIAAMQAKDGISQEQRTQQIIEQEEATLRANNLGEL